MKHPKYRVSDVLYMDQDVLQSLVQQVREWMPLLAWENSDKLQTFAKQYGVPAVPRLEMVGSYVFGNATLHSDIDFNLAFPNWDMQQAARMLYYTRDFRLNFAKAKEDWGNKNGFRMDVGCVDAQSIQYNIFLDCDTMLLHFRYAPDVMAFTTGDNPVSDVERVEEQPPINVLTFNPEKDEAPPVHKIHLRLDNYSFRWKAYPNELKDRKAQWIKDEFVDQRDAWKKTYGTRFTDYQKVGDALVEV